MPLHLSTGVLGRLPLLPISLVLRQQTVAVLGLLDTAATVNGLPDVGEASHDRPNAGSPHYARLAVAHPIFVQHEPMGKKWLDTALDPIYN